jgi:hypothetical protein
MIDPKRVNELLIDCLFRNEELGDTPNIMPEGGVKVEATMVTFGFHPDRLQAHRFEVVEMLKQLDDSFMQSKGGGMSLMNMVATKDGELWTGIQKTADELFALAKGMDLADFTLPRDMWVVLPGQMPYITIYDTKFDEPINAQI